MTTDSTTTGRWMAFNGVGLVGVGVQLGVLALLTTGLGLQVPFATLLAVESAILHNFAWHQRVTWRDRQSTGGRDTVKRLLRFHALNGLVSLIGNVVITAALSGGGMHPLAANAIAIAVCSTLNFFLGDRFVFAKHVSLPLCLFGVAVPAVFGSSVVSAKGGGDDTSMYVSGPSAAALDAWNRYVATVEKRHATPDASSFFALDARRLDRWRDRATAGTVPMVEVTPPAAPDAKIHHWSGAIYIPNTTVGAVVKRMQEYAGRESEFYVEVKASKLLQRDGDRLKVFLRLQRDAGVVSADYNTEHAVEYRSLGATRASSRSVSTKIAELEYAGTPRERELAPGQDRGFLWRLNAYWRFEQAGTGVFIECESVSLSRGVPWVVRPIASPIVNRIARESLDRTLRSLRTFLTRAG